MFGLDGVRCAQVVSNPMFGDLDLHAMEEADMQDDVKDSIHRYNTPTLLSSECQGSRLKISTIPSNIYSTLHQFHNISWMPHFRNQHSVTKTPALVGAGCLPTTTVG